MITKSFLSAVLGTSGTYCLFYANRDNKKDITTRYFDSIDGLSEAALAVDSSIYSVYFTPFTFSKPDRRQVNALVSRSFFLDVDCGPDKTYKTKLEGFKALSDFIKALSLPKPLLTDSGNGLQAFWLLQEEVEASKWKAVAEAFKQRCYEQNFDVDPAVTADSARLLRVVGTNNRSRHEENLGQIVPCVVLGKESPARVAFDDFAKLVNNGMIPVPKSYAPAPRTFDAITEKLMGNRTSNFGTIMRRSAAGDGCQQILNAVANQADVDEPMWRAVLSIAKFCKNGTKDIHKVSQGHPNYNFSETEIKADLIKGPYLCERFQEYNPTGCEGCPHKGVIKSPIVLGSEHKVLEGEVVVEEENAETGEIEKYTKPTLPHGYFRGQNSAIYLEKFNKQGDSDPLCISPYDMYIVHRITDLIGGDMAVIRIHYPNDGVREFTMPMRDMAGEELRKTLADKGFPNPNHKEIGIYLSNFVAKLTHEDISNEAHRQFGWTAEMDGFVIGESILRPNKPEERNFPTSSTAQFLPRFETKGTLEEWKQMVSFFNKPKMETYQLLMYMSFGSALMEFTGLASCGVHIHSMKSGFGKTTLKQAMASVWGKSKELINKANDTQNSRLNRMETFRNLPFLIDEMTGKESRFLSEYAYTLVDGSQRNRLSSSANKERHRGMPWSCITVTSANESLLEKISAHKVMPEAEAMRILEIQVYKNPDLDKEETDKFFRDTTRFYGHAGKLFMQYVLDNLDDVKRLLDDMQAKFDKAAGLSPEHRFWSAALACALVAGVIVSRMQLLPYDWGKVQAHAVKLVHAAKSNVKTFTEAATPSSIITSFWEDAGVRRLVIDTNADATTDALVPPSVALSTIPTQGIIARYESNRGMLYLSSKALKDWCIEKNIVFNSFVDEAINTLDVCRKKKRMAAGTPYDLNSVQAFRVNVSKLEGFSTDDSEDRSDSA